MSAKPTFEWLAWGDDVKVTFLDDAPDAADVEAAVFAAWATTKAVKQTFILEEDDFKTFCDAVGVADEEDFEYMVQDLTEAYPILDRMTVCPSSPECREGAKYPVFETVMHLNDRHHWTRGLIADWVDSLG